MYSSPAVPSSPSCNPAPETAPTSPTRRLRGLSYLRTYTQNHLLSRESHHNTGSSQRPSITTRAASYPSPTSSPITRSSAAPSPTSPNIPRQTSPTVLRSAIALPPTRSSDSLGSTSGWLPTVAGHSGVSRLATEPQSTAAASSAAVLAVNSQLAIPADLSTSMARTRAAIVDGATDMPQFDGGVDSHLRNGSSATTNDNDVSHGMSHQLPSIRFTAHQDPRAQRPSLVFSPMARILPTGRETIKVGRYSERDNQPIQAANVPSAAPVGFKSKVVSRRHCEFWYSGGRWFIKDVKSSSGTFLNHIRLSSPGTESRPFPVNDGDIVQLGIDFKGGEEMIFRCVKIRVELNKGWQNGPSNFNIESLNNLKRLNSQGRPSRGSTSQDCSICLGPIAPCQSLFVAPCSHTWHYKCIRVIINGPNWPHFICPNCRTVADLEAELDDHPYAEELAEEEEGDINAVGQTLGPNGVKATPQSREIASSIATDGPLVPQSLLEESDQDREQHGPIDSDVADRSDDSDRGPRVSRAAEELDHLTLSDSASPPTTSILQPRKGSNATVLPVDIISRKAVSTSSSSRIENLSSRSERRTIRTPSPGGLPPCMTDGIASTEGPMTPRNDAGPFVFDGSAGQLSDLRLAGINLDSAAHQSVEPASETSS